MAFMVTAMPVFRRPPVTRCRKVRITIRQITVPCRTTTRRQMLDMAISIVFDGKFAIAANPSLFAAQRFADLAVTSASDKFIPRHVFRLSF